MKQLHATSCPFLSQQVQLANSGQDLLVETDDIVLSFGGSSARLLRDTRLLLSGMERLDRIAARTATSVAELGPVLDVLASEHLLIDAAAMEEASELDSFMDAYFHECEFWAREIVSRPFWRTVLAGEADAAVILGWGIEFFHFVSAANEHMAFSVSSCRDNPHVRGLLANHYLEESHHGDLFLTGLAGVGLDPEQVKSAPPLASTMALIDHLNELAMSDLMAYASVFGVMQQSRAPKSSDAINKFFSLLIDRYPFAESMLSAFCQHARMDVNLDHNELTFEKLCARRWMFSREEKKTSLWQCGVLRSISSSSSRGSRTTMAARVCQSRVVDLISGR